MALAFPNANALGLYTHNLLLFMVAKHKSKYKSTKKMKEREMGEERENELIG